MGIFVTHNYIDDVQTHRFKLSKPNMDEISLPMLWELFQSRKPN
jgi:hypothetical protein